MMQGIILKTEDKAEHLQEEAKEAKEAEVKPEEEADLKEAKTNQVTAERIPKDKGRVKEQVEERAIAIGKPPKQEVSRLPITRKRRLAHTERDAGTCAILVIAPNGMNAEKNKKLNGNAEMRKRNR